jgi:hypothetical protein
VLAPVGERWVTLELIDWPKGWTVTYLSELVNGQSFAAGLDDAGTSGSCEAHGCDGQLGEFEETIDDRISILQYCLSRLGLPGVIGDLGNYDNGLSRVGLCVSWVDSIGYDTGEGHWGSCLQA